MNEKEIILASIASSIACNCIPCYEHYWLRAQEEGISKGELNEAVEIGEKVKSGAAVVIRNKVDLIQQSDVPEEELGLNSPCSCGCN